MSARPESLRQYLDQGGDLGHLPEKSLLYWLCELVVDDRRHYGIDEMRRQHEEYMSKAWERTRRRQEVLASAPTPNDRRSWKELMADEDLIDKWTDELLADESLFDRVEAALPRDLVDSMLLNMDAETKPYDVVAEERETYVCACTGETHHGRAIVIRPRGFHEEDAKGLPEMVFSPGVFSAPPGQRLRSAS